MEASTKVKMFHMSKYSAIVNLENLLLSPVEELYWGTEQPCLHCQILLSGKCQARLDCLCCFFKYRPTYSIASDDVMFGCLGNVFLRAKTTYTDSETLEGAIPCLAWHTISK